MKPVIYIRVEANPVIATGHMMRCLSIAETARRQGIEVVFIVAEPVAEAFPKERGFEVICLAHDWQDLDGELPLLLSLIQERQIAYLIVDSYQVTENYLQTLKQVTTLLYIDDLHEAVWPCHLLLNYGIGAKNFPYKQRYPEETRCLLGPAYFPLRESYLPLKEKVQKEKVERILVVTGGADVTGFCKPFAEQLKEQRELQGTEFVLIAGRFHPEYEALEKLAAQIPNLTLKSNLPSLKEEIMQADLMITAGGITIYEMAACGTPGILLCTAENQRDNVEGFCRDGLALGLMAQSTSEVLPRLWENLKKLQADAQGRRTYGKRLQQLVDGKGSERILHEIIYYRASL